MLFAQASTGTSDTRMALMLFLSSTIGGAFVYLVNLALKVRDENRARRCTKEKTIVQHKDELIERLDRENQEKQKEIEQLNVEKDRHFKRETMCRIRDGSKAAHIRYLERVLSNNGLTFEKYQEPPENDPDGSDVHKTLGAIPPQGPTPTPPLPSGETNPKGEKTK